MTMEATTDRIARLELTDISDARRELLERANEIGVGDEVFARLGDAVRVSETDTIVLPPGRFERLSRGRGWARKGRGDRAEWGERVDGGYEVGPGRWSVGSTDGFNRKGATSWKVAHVKVGSETWTVAE